jgi:hypothetical protein
LIGTPQCGHAAASLLTSLWHSAQVMIAIVLLKRVGWTSVAESGNSPRQTRIVPAVNQSFQAENQHIGRCRFVKVDASERKVRRVHRALRFAPATPSLPQPALRGKSQFAAEACVLASDIVIDQYPQMNCASASTKRAAAPVYLAVFDLSALGSVDISSDGVNSNPGAPHEEGQGARSHYEKCGRYLCPNSVIVIVSGQQSEFRPWPSAALPLLPENFRSLHNCGHRTDESEYENGAAGKD